MIKVKRIDHVAIAVSDRDGAANDLGSLFGLFAGVREHVDNQNTDVAFLHPTAQPTLFDAAEAGFDSATAIEIIAPASVSGNPGLARFLDKRGPGLHHICFEVDDLPAALASLKAAGVRLIDETPRPGARGHMVAFVHPASTGGVLFELCATPQGAPA
jgi:methylmalonyl-CoA/ethylmalonyl-CoA epimerase